MEPLPRITNKLDSRRAQRRFLGKAALVGGIATIGSAIVGLVLAPLIIHQVGLTVYGLWALLGMFSGLAGLADIGIGRASAYYIARAHRPKTVARIFYSGAAVLSFGALILLLGTASLVFWGFGGLLGKLEIPHATALSIAVCGMLVLVLSLGTSFLRAFLEATLKIHLTQVLLFVFQLLNYSAVLGVALLDSEFAWLLGTTVGVHFILFLIHVLVCLREGLPPPCAPSSRIVRVLLGRSVGYFALGVVSIITMPLNRIALTVYGGGAAHALLDLALKVAMAATALLQVINAPLFTVLAKNDAKDRKSISLVWSMVATSFVLYVAGMIALALLAPTLAELLVPEEHSRFAVILMLLVGGIAFTGVSEPVIRAFWAWGWERKVARVRVCTFTGNVGLLLAISVIDPAIAVSFAYGFPLLVGSIAMLGMLIGLSARTRNGNRET